MMPMSAVTIVMATGGPPGALKATSCCLNDKLDQPGSIAPLGSMVSVSSVDDDDCGLVGRLSSPTAEFGHAAGHNAMHRTEPSLSQTVDVRTKTFQDIRRQSELAASLQIMWSGTRTREACRLAQFARLPSLLP